MMGRIERVRAINGAYGIDTKKNEQLAAIRYELEKHFTDSLGYENQTIRNGVTQEFIVIQHNDTNKKKIKCRPSDSLDVGDVIECYGEKYIVTDVDPNNQIQTSGVMQRCNYILPFQIGASEIYYEPCIVDDKTTLDTGIKDGKVLSLPDTRRVIRVQYNERTAQLRVGKRIFVDMPFDDAGVYRITEINRVTEMRGNKGIWIIKCDEDVINPATDRVDLLIADYKEPQNVPQPSNPDEPPAESTEPLNPDHPSPIVNYRCEITYNGKPEIKVGGSAKTFTGHFFDGENNEITDVEAVWTIENEYDGLVQIKEQMDNKIKIQIANGSGLAGKTFVLVLSTADGLCECKLEVRMVNLY